MASLFRHRPRPQSLRPAYRAFSTTPISSVSLQLEKNDPEAVADTLPPYPYGPARRYKQSDLGLYGGQRVRFGNNVGEKFENKTRRAWRPNVLTRKLYSKALERPVQVRVTTRVLRTIDKLGGLDEYLLGEKEARIRELGESGWWLRFAIMQTPAIKARFAAERIALRLSEEQAAEEDAEVAEARAVIEETSELDPEAEAPEVSEPLGTDGAFQVEQPPGVAPLKFRVGPGKHLILTPTGWRRTRPDPNRLVDMAKARILRGLEAEHASQRKYEPEFQRAREKAARIRQRSAEKTAKSLGSGESPSADQQTLTSKEIRQVERGVLPALAAQIFDKKVALSEERKVERRARKREAAQLERARKAVVVEEE
ncbi:hypothetical protein LTR53_011121 [Teratosphaeriaceae sp. CCFEE 6253]|nr:hypothetical protein LTR53_011121 [Teratosphaeriaceae sp. CCFEE 6253]